MANSEECANVVYRTVQRTPGLGGEFHGPIFDNMEAAKATLESFARDELGVAPAGWETLDDGTLEMTPSRSRQVLAVETVRVRQSSTEVVPETEAVPA